ncbi:hypothetical protein [Streptacidiphilus cavernicola]|uniref:Small secreted protein n=1 Tax=Streptacidiphilus cavernicola TaxID=3342716 RepID=A0ABV6W1U0_9ACTN
MTGTAGRGLAALTLAACALVTAVGCASSDSPSASAAATSPRAFSTDPTKGGPCRATMNHITDAGKRITSDAKDKAKATTDLQAAGDRFTSDADTIKNPEAKKAAQQLGSIYHSLADNAKHNRNPDSAKLQTQVQGAIAALSSCAAAE